MPRAEGYDQIMALWGIQESLLQTYRGIFITVESILFGIAAAIFPQNATSSLVLTFLGLFVLWMWHQVCANRAKDVSFVQWLLIQAEAGVVIEGPLATLKRFQAGEIIAIGTRTVWRKGAPAPAGQTNDEPYVSMTRSPTRRWMEVYLPCVFLFLWVLLAFVAIPSVFGAPAP